MGFLFAFLLMFVCTSAHSATMCVPDLSTCESCTDGTYDGYSWSANCCGVQVSGYVFFVEGGMPNRRNKWQNFANFPDNLEGDDDVYNDNYNPPVCVMTSPVVAKYAVIVGDEDCSIVYGGYVSAYGCALYFNPSCALTECNRSFQSMCTSTDPL